MSTVTPTSVQALHDKCKRQCIALRLQHWPRADRADADQYLYVACLEALETYDAKRGASLETHAINCWRHLMLAEAAQMRYGVELDATDEIVDDTDRRLMPESYIYKWYPHVFDAEVANERVLAEREREVERRALERLAILPTNAGDFTRAMINGGLSSSQAAASVGLQPRQGRNLLLEALSLLEDRPRAAQLDLFGELRT